MIFVITVPHLVEILLPLFRAHHRVHARIVVRRMSVRMSTQDVLGIQMHTSAQRLVRVGLLDAQHAVGQKVNAVPKIAFVITDP